MNPKTPTTCDLLEKTTPGPWFVRGRLGFGWHILGQRLGPAAQIAVAYGESNPDGEHNAALISLAPDYGLLLRAMVLGYAQISPLLVGESARLGLHDPDIGWRWTDVDLDAAGCPVLDERLRARLRERLDLP